MTKNARTRSYLSQIAQPIASGESMLTVRHAASRPDTPMQSLVPTIVESFGAAMDAGPQSALKPIQRHSEPDVPRQEQPTKSVASAIEPAKRVAAPKGASKSLPGQMETKVERKGSDSPKVMTPLPQAADGPLARRILRAVSVQAAVPITNAASRASTAVVKESEPTGAKPTAPARDAMARQPGPTGIRAAEAAGRVPAPLSKSAIDATSQNSADHLDQGWKRPASEKAIPRKQPEAIRTVAALSDEGRMERGAQVHIGTIEIRAVMPQQPVKPPAAVMPAQPPESRSGQSSSRSGAAEPLARGLAWRFGFIQG